VQRSTNVYPNYRGLLLVAEISGETVGHRTERKRAGGSARKMIRAELWRTARENWRRLAVVYVGFVGVMGVMILAMWIWSSQTVAVFFAGMTLGALPLLWLGFLQGAGFSHRSLGPEAERWTAGLLAKLDRRTWRVFHDLPLEHTNVDHVIVGPGRIYAVETKWTSMRPDRQVRQRLGDQARRRARELSAALEQRGCRRTVTPLLIIWGPHALRTLGEGTELLVRRAAVGADDVRIVAGSASKAWLPKLHRAAEGLEFDHVAERALEALAEGDAEPAVG
jgi:hypothetical protein